MEDYKGGREYGDLSKFAQEIGLGRVPMGMRVPHWMGSPSPPCFGQESLGPSCGPSNKELCDEDGRKGLGDIKCIQENGWSK